MIIMLGGGSGVSFPLLKKKSEYETEAGVETVKPEYYEGVYFYLFFYYAGVNSS